MNWKTKNGNNCGVNKSKKPGQSCVYFSEALLNLYIYCPESDLLPESHSVGDGLADLVPNIVSLE